VAHIQSAGCKAQTKSVIGAHKRRWKYLLCAITKPGEAKHDVEFIHDFEFIGEDKDKLRQLSKCGGKRKPETSYHGRIKRKGCLWIKRKGC
jgi:hypothetical protein